MISSRLFLLTVAVGVLLGLHPLILRGCARLLVVDQRGGPVACVLIASGDGRFEAAARWVRELPCRRILLVQDQPERIVELGLLPSAEAIAQRELAKLRVPEEQIYVLSASEHAGGHATGRLTAWMEHHPDTRVAVLCDQFASCELRWRIDAAAAGSVARRIDLWALPDRRYDEHNWWRNRTGIRQFVLRSIMLAYTWLSGGASDAPLPLTVEQYEALVQDQVTGDR